MLQPGSAEAIGFTWTADEVDLLLRVTNEYKTQKSLGTIDWESCTSKFGDIQERFTSQYQSPEDALCLVTCYVCFGVSSTDFLQGRFNHAS